MFANTDKNLDSILSSDQSPGRLATGRHMSALWAGFAHKSHPSARHVPRWPAYTLKERAPMWIDASARSSTIRTETKGCSGRTTPEARQSPHPGAFRADRRRSVTVLPDSSLCCMAMWTMNRFGGRAVSVFSPGSKKRRSPGRMTSMGPASRWQRPMPSVTRSLPVRVVVPGGARARHEAHERGGEGRGGSGRGDGVTYGRLVNQSAEPFWESMLERVIRVSSLSSLPAQEVRLGGPARRSCCRPGRGSRRADDRRRCGQDRAVERDVGGGQLAVELFHGARSDDR